MPSTKKEFAPPIPSGVSRMTIPILCGLVFLTVIYVGVIAMYSTLAKWFNIPPPASEFCPNDDEEHCERPDLFAFEVASGLALVVCAVIGFRSWHITRVHETKLPATPEGRLFGHLHEADWLCAASFTFQLWDLVLSVLIPEQCTTIMLCHHALAALIAWYGLNNQYFHYYAIFFLGCSEISGPFLVLVDIARFFPPVPNSTFAWLVGSVAGPIFAVSFTFYRIFLWWQVSYLMWTDIQYVLTTGISNKLRPGRNHVLYVMLAGNITLGLLQIYWWTMILEEAKKLLV